MNTVAETALRAGIHLRAALALVKCVHKPTESRRQLGATWTRSTKINGLNSRSQTLHKPGFGIPPTGHKPHGQIECLRDGKLANLSPNSVHMSQNNSTGPAVGQGEIERPKCNPVRRDPAPLERERVNP